MGRAANRKWMARAIRYIGGSEKAKKFLPRRKFRRALSWLAGE